MEIYREFTFDAAHRLQGLPGNHRCGNLHGHTFTVVVYLEGIINEERGWVIDYGEVKKICNPIIDTLDHSFLNDIPGLENPTSECIAIWLWGRIKPLIPELTMIEVKETAKTGCRYRG
jgi:6-pyruvoyltetrahydropterin/6-carboxytetrahydropterin synthase